MNADIYHIRKLTNKNIFNNFKNYMNNYIQ